MKTLLLSLAVLMTAGKVPTGFAETTGESLYSEENEILLDEEKEYCPADINSLFADDRVLVTLKSRNSNPEGIPDEVIASLFEGINYSCCRDLSKVTLNDSLKEYYRKHPFHQIYRLDLTNGSKEKVLDACARLNEIDEVLSATPDYYCEAESLTPSDGEYHEQWGLHGTYGINAPARIADALNLVKIGRWAIDGFEMRNVLLFDNYRIDDTPSAGVVPTEIEHVLRMVVADRQ